MGEGISVAYTSFGTNKLTTNTGLYFTRFEPSEYPAPPYNPFLCLRRFAG